MSIVRTTSRTGVFGVPALAPPPPEPASPGAIAAAPPSVATSGPAPSSVIARTFTTQECLAQDGGALGALSAQVTALTLEAASYRQRLDRIEAETLTRLRELSAGIAYVEKAAPTLLSGMSALQNTTEQLEALRTALTSDAARALAAPVLAAVDDAVERIVKSVSLLARGG